MPTKEYQEGFDDGYNLRGRNSNSWFYRKGYIAGFIARKAAKAAKNWRKNVKNPKRV